VIAKEFRILLLLFTSLMNDNHMTLNVRFRCKEVRDGSAGLKSPNPLVCDSGGYYVISEQS
jgi:hypothetical protein